VNSDVETSHILHADILKTLPTIERGEGIYLYDTSGKRYLDGSSGPVACNIGHGVKEIAEALGAQAERVCYVYRKHFTSEAIEKLADLIVEMTPGTLKKVFFLSSGSEASEMAAKIARQYYLEHGKMRKEMIISRWLSYHGITMGALSMSGHVLRRRDYINSLLPYPKIPPPYCYRCPLKTEYPGCKVACAHNLKETIQMSGEEYFSAFIAEPVVGATGGAMTPPPEYYETIREICDEFDILFIADEVMTGFGRTGLSFGIDHWKVIPDIITFGKGISAGCYPLAGVIISEKIYQVLKNGKAKFIPGHTFCGTPLAGTIGIKVIEFIKEHDVIGNVHQLSGYLMDQLRSLYKYSIVGDIRGKGFLTGIEFVRDQKTREPFDFKESGKVSHLIAEKSFENGLIVYPGGGTVDGHRGDHILVAPPLIIKKDEIDELVFLLDQSIKEVETSLSYR
jgi:adenosylmethionine-8-amino-7-oxononanoate aminotransferase